MYGTRLPYCGLLFTLLSGAFAAQNVVTTIAGLDPIFDGDGNPDGVAPRNSGAGVEHRGADRSGSDDSGEVNTY